VKSDGSVVITPQKKDPQIWHHKWMWVEDGYKGFNVEESELPKPKGLGFLFHRRKLAKTLRSSQRFLSPQAFSSKEQDPYAP